MPSFFDVGAYLDVNKLEAELSDAVADIVEEEQPQPLAVLADRLRHRAAALAVDFDYGELTAEIRELVKRDRGAGPLLMSLAFADAATFSAALGGGGPNAALRFADGGEGCFSENITLAKRAVPLLEPLKARFPNVSRADLWAHAANVALEVMGGSKVHTRFGRRDAASSSDGVQSAEGRLVDETALGIEHKAAHLRSIMRHKGFVDREIVALQGRHTVGEVMLERASSSDGAWTEAPLTFDNTYFTSLVNKRYEPHGSSTGVEILRCKASGTIMLPMDECLLHDPAFRLWAEKYASDPAKFASEFALAWTKLTELGCAGLQPHPHALTYASSCFLPNEWLELPLVTRREVSHDSTVYGFGLPEGKSLDLPVCACILAKAPGLGRGTKGKDDWDGSDAVRPYTPISDNEMRGKFELLVKRYDHGAVSQYLHRLQLGTKVAFRHIRFNIKAQYPFEGKTRFTMICGGTGITPMYQALWKILGTSGDERKVTLLCGNKTTDDILLRDELDEWAAVYPHRLTVVHVIGETADAKPPAGWVTTPTYTAESGWIDARKIQKYAFAPSADTLVFVCGLPAMYKALCGPREEKVLAEGSTLSELGYTTDMVTKL